MPTIPKIMIIFGVLIIGVGGFYAVFFNNISIGASSLFLGAGFFGASLFWSMGNRKWAGYIIIIFVIAALVAFFRPDLLGTVLPSNVTP